MLVGSGSLADVGLLVLESSMVTDKPENITSAHGLLKAAQFKC